MSGINEAKTDMPEMIVAVFMILSENFVNNKTESKRSMQVRQAVINGPKFA